jgi:hypothetical protein
MGNVPPVGFLTTKGHRLDLHANVEVCPRTSPNQLQNVLGCWATTACFQAARPEATERIDWKAPSSD